jgi:hypothetical protein
VLADQIGKDQASLPPRQTLLLDQHPLAADRNAPCKPDLQPHRRSSHSLARNLLTGLAALLAATALALALAAGVSGAPTRSSGMLELKATFTQKWSMSRDFCPTGTPALAICLRSVGESYVVGLGRVTVTYDKLLPGDDPACFIQHNNTAVMEVAGKGTLELSRPGRACGSGPPPREEGPFQFTVAGGTGTYVGAAGTLMYLSFVPASRGTSGTARDTWTGTLTVPGLEFDVTPPVLTGAVSKTVRAPKGAKRVRVRYAVKAVDAVDGTLRSSARRARAASSCSGGRGSAPPPAIRAPTRARRCSRSRSGGDERVPGGGAGRLQPLSRAAGPAGAGEREADRGRRIGDGNEGVDGSSPSEGFATAPQTGAFCMCSVGAGASEGADGAVNGPFASRRRGRLRNVLFSA